MKIKNIITLALAATAVSPVLTSCYDLELTPNYQVASGSFFKTEEQCKQGLMAVYSKMHDIDLFGMYPVFDGLGPEAKITNGGGLSYRDFTIDKPTASSSYVKSRWVATWEAIARANNAIHCIGQADIDAEKKEQLQAEARFLRGLYYFHLVDIWGEVPIYDDTFLVGTDYANMLYPRSSVEEVISFILKDFEAAEILPDKWDASNYGRATRGAALAMKGKTLLYSKRYREASEAFKELINSNIYSLYPNYAELFTPNGDSCDEMIFLIMNTGGVGQDIGMPLATFLGSRSTYTSAGTGCLNYNFPSNKLIEEYEWADGRPFSWEEFIPGFYSKKSTSTSNPYPVAQETFLATLTTDKTGVKKYPKAKDKLIEMWNSRDPRMNMSIILPYTHYTGWYDNQPVDLELVVAKSIKDGCGMIRIDKDRLCALWRKFVPEGNMNGLIHEASDTPINFPLIRYADVLLMQAECLNELGDQAGAVKLINEVRSRPSVNMPGINSGPDYLAANNKEEVFERIVHERMIELACEGHSFSDWRRWGKYQELDGMFDGHITRDYTFSYRSLPERRNLWPIPQAEIDQNPLLTQNPGY